MSGHVKGCIGCTLCQKRLRLSWKVDTCKTLATGESLSDDERDVMVGRCRLT
jgi:hypothetical protein